MTNTQNTTPDRAVEDRVRKATRNLRSSTRRVAKEGFGRNSQGTMDSAEYNYRRALSALVTLEDEHGVEAVAKLSDGLRDAAYEARVHGLLSPLAIERIEKSVLAKQQDPVARNQSKHVGDDGKLRYDADGSEVFPGPTGVRRWGVVHD